MYLYQTGYPCGATVTAGPGCEPKAVGDAGYFIIHFELFDRTPLQNLVIVTYFAFTSLSTVGFGDYNPRSDEERIFCGFILLFGVAIFSYIMGIFIEILQKYQDLNRDLDEGDNLTKFFGLLT